MAIMIANGTAMHYVVDNFSPPWAEEVETIYVQHGLGRTVKFWTHWVPCLAHKFRFVRRDMRGHGKSEVPPEGHRFSLNELVDDVEIFIDGLGEGPVHYVGEAISGIVGILAALRAPRRFRSLTLVGTAPVVHASIRQALAGNASADIAGTLGGGVEAWVREVLIPKNIISGGESDAQRRWVIEEYCSNPAHVLQGITASLGAIDLWPVLPNLSVPTLIVTCAQSPITHLPDQIKMREVIPRAKLAVIDGPTYEIYVDRRDQCISALLEFLDCCPR